MTRFLSILLLMTPLFGNAQQDKFSLTSALNEGRTYGSYCGFAGQHPPTRIAAEELIASANLSELENWLDSPNDVVKTYAVEGIIRISNDQKVTLTQETLNKLERLKNSDREISTCSGCVFTNVTMAEALRHFELENS